MLNNIEDTIIYICIAHNTSDFKDTNQMTAATTQDAAEAGMTKHLTERWHKEVEPEDDFYHTLEDYLDCWRYHQDSCILIK